MIVLIGERVTSLVLQDMLDACGVYVKLAVDIERRVIAGGADLHYKCEQKLLQDGSKQKDIWGADWYPYNQELAYESMINIRPSQNNRTMEIQSPLIRDRVAQIVQEFFGGVEDERF